MEPKTTPRSSLEEAKALYRKLARENHPDHGGDPEAMKAINAAFGAIIPLLEEQKPVKTIEQFTAEVQAMDDMTLRQRVQEIEASGVTFRQMTAEQRVLIDEDMQRKFRAHAVRPIGKPYKGPPTPEEQAELFRELERGTEELSKLNEQMKKQTL